MEDEILSKSFRPKWSFVKLIPGRFRLSHDTTLELRPLFRLLITRWLDTEVLRSFGWSRRVDWGRFYESISVVI
jgi:hypothetical protein